MTKGPSRPGFSARLVRATRAAPDLFRLLAFVLLALVPIVELRAQGVDGTMPVERPAAVAAAEDTERDALHAERVRRALSAVPGLERVLVRVDAGVVTLRGRASDSTAAERAVELAGLVEGTLTVVNEIEEVTDLSERLGNFIERSEQRFWRALAFVPLILAALVAFAFVVLIGRWLSRRRWPFRPIAPNAFIAALLRQVVLIASVIAAIVIALDILNATALLSTVLGAAGIVGLAVGFAVRDTVENYVASILLSVRQPFRPQDFVSIDEHMGTVAKLTSRATILLTPDGNHLRVPNAVVYKAVIVNYTLNPTRRFDFAVGVAPDSDVDEALEVGARALRELPFTLDEPPELVWVEELGDWSIVLRYAAWIDQRETGFLQARSEAMRLVKLSLEEAGFVLPEPTYRVHGLPGGGAVPARTPHAHADTHEVRDVTPDRTLERQVEEDDSLHEDDLLDESAPREV